MAESAPCVEVLVDVCAAQQSAREREFLRALNDLRQGWLRLPNDSRPQLTCATASEKIEFLEQVLVRSQTVYRHSYQLLGRNCAWTANRFKNLAITFTGASRLEGDQITQLYQGAGVHQVDAATIQGRWWRAILDLFVRVLHLFYCKVFSRAAGIGKGTSCNNGSWKAAPLQRTSAIFPSVPEWATPRALASGNMPSSMRGLLANPGSRQVLDSIRRQAV